MAAATRVHRRSGKTIDWDDVWFDPICCVGIRADILIDRQVIRAKVRIARSREAIESQPRAEVPIRSTDLVRVFVAARHLVVERQPTRRRVDISVRQIDGLRQITETGGVKARDAQWLTADARAGAHEPAGRGEGQEHRAFAAEQVDRGERGGDEAFQTDAALLELTVRH